MTDSAQDHIERGLELKNSGQYDQALEEFQAAMDDDPACDEIYHQIGLVYYFTGEFEENVVWLEKAVVINPSNLKARIDLALSYMSIFGDNDKAREQLEEVLRQDPSHEEANRHIVFL
ncbi:MAG: tetratricopeptide repeat protein [bacterium]